MAATTKIEEANSGDKTLASAIKSILKTTVSMNVV